jgi:type VI secretion system protein ImpI
MSLTLQLVNETTLPDGGPVSFRITGKRGIDIGRDAHLDWTLPDPTRYISSKHCEIRYKDGGYWLHDVSTNGTFLNGSQQRMSTPHRLRDGDRFVVGHYIVAVKVEGDEQATSAASVPAPQAMARPASDQDLWTAQGDIPPPIDPKQLKPPRDSANRSDFLDWAADVPNPHWLPSAPRAEPPSSPRVSITPDAGAWAEGPPSYIPPPAPAAAPRPAPRRPGEADNPWDSDTPVASDSPPQAVPRPSRAAPASAPAGLAIPDSFILEIARAAGLSEDVLAQKSPAELAQQIGSVLRLVTESLMQLLNARQQAKRLARSSQHTMVQAVDNNPLKFCSSSADALRIMFGPASSSYLDAGRAIGQGFEDVKAHQLKTYAAMQQAITMLVAGIDPSTIEGESEGRGIAGLMTSRKAKLWDAYVAQWDAKIGSAGGGPIEAFMRYFAEAYDRNQG